MPNDICMVKYHDIDHAIHASFVMKNAKTGQVFYAKTDIKSAFHVLPLSPHCYRWLIMKVKNPVTQKFQYFIDKCLPFGASISCSHFQRFSNALKHIFEHETGYKGLVTNYLDDFLFVLPSQAMCNSMVSKFLRICKKLGVPIAIEKTEFANKKMIFLGILLHRDRFIMTIPEEKKIRAINWLSQVLEK